MGRKLDQWRVIALASAIRRAKLDRCRVSLSRTREIVLGITSVAGLPARPRVSGMDSKLMPFTRPRRLRRGYTVKQLRGPKFQRLFRGVYLPAGEPVTLLQRARGGADGRATAARTPATTRPRAVGSSCRRTPTRPTSACPSEGTRSIRRGIFGPSGRDRPSPPYERRGVPVSAPVAVFSGAGGAAASTWSRSSCSGDSLVRRTGSRPRVLVAAAAQLVRQGRSAGAAGGQPGPSGCRLRHGDAGSGC